MLLHTCGKCRIVSKSVVFSKIFTCMLLSRPFGNLHYKYSNILHFSQYDSPSSPLVKSLQVIKLYDLVTFHIATFMYKFQNQLLPTAFHSFFTKVTNIHKYNTRLAAKQSYYLPFVRTNYGKFINTRFHGSSIWNCIDKDIKLSSKSNV